MPVPSATVSYAAQGNAQSTNVRAMSIVTMLFFMWGFLTCLNDILIPHLQTIFDLNYARAMLVQFSFFSSYFVFAFPAGKLVEWRGYKQGMTIGLLIMACGALMFLPASTLASFNVFLAALVVLAAGITLLQVSANPYVTHLGPERTAASRLNLAQAFNSLGTTIAPYLGGAVILSGVYATTSQLHNLSGPMLQQYRMQQASSVRLPYLMIAVALALLALAIGLIKLPKMDFTRDIRPGEFETTTDSIFKHPYLLLGALGIFVYVGAEVSIGSFLVKYFALPDIGNLSPKSAAALVSFYWGGAMVGRFIGSAVLQRFKTGLVLGMAAIIAGLLVVTSILTHGHIALISILAVGFFNSVMFPNIFTLGLANLGPLTSKGSSLLVAAIVGGALIPLAEGRLADSFGVQRAFFLPAACYIYIAVFGFIAPRNPNPPKSIPVEAI